MQLQIPGPTPLPPAVLDAMQREMMPHRGPAANALIQSILTRAQEVHRTSGEVLIWPASGSAGWEIAIVNLLSPGDRVLATIAGDFGARFAKTGEAFGLDVQRLEVAPGQAITPDLLGAKLAELDGVKAAFVTHNETSTGVTNPLPELARVVKDYGALVIVDGVSSVAGLPLEMDTWGIDFILSGSQKAWMCPPGLVIVGVGPKAWAAHGESRFPRFFWDLTAAREAAARHTTVTTPPLTLLFALDAALTLILDEGLEEVWARHHALGEQTRHGLREIGLDLLAEPGVASDTVTAFRPPAGVSASAFTKAVAASGIELAVGQGALKEEIVRIGHMGWCHAPDITATLAAIAEVVPGLRSSVAETAGAGVV